MSAIRNIVTTSGRIGYKYPPGYKIPTKHIYSKPKKIKVKKSKQKERKGNIKSNGHYHSQYGYFYPSTWYYPDYYPIQNVIFSTSSHPFYNLYYDNYYDPFYTYYY